MEQSLLKITLLAALCMLPGCIGCHKQEEASNKKVRAQLASLPYTTWHDVKEEHRGKTGVTVYDRDHAQPGLNLYCPYMSDVVYLISMTGEVVKTWKLGQAHRQKSAENEPPNPGLGCLLPVLAESGDLYVVNEGGGLARYKWGGQLASKTDVFAHHDLQLAEVVNTLTMKPGTYRFKGHELTFIVDYFTALDAQGKIVREVNLLDAVVGTDALKRQVEEFISFILLKYLVLWKGGRVDACEGDEISECGDNIAVKELIAKSPNRTAAQALARELKQQGKSLSSLVARMNKRKFQEHLLHTNSLQVIPWASAPGQKKSAALISMKNLDTVAVIDLEQKKALWRWGAGEIQGQHQASALPNGNILLFDNGTRRRRSRVVEVSPSTGEIAWQIGLGEQLRFFSNEQGGVQNLPNGNLLITESETGRALEVTRDGKTVWEFFGHDEAWKKDQRRTIYRMTRIEQSVVEQIQRKHAPVQG